MEQYSTGTGCDDGNDQTDHGIRGVRLAVIQAAHLKVIDKAADVGHGVQSAGGHGANAVNDIGRQAEPQEVILHVFQSDGKAAGGGTGEAGRHVHGNNQLENGRARDTGQRAQDQLIAGDRSHHASKAHYSTCGTDGGNGIHRAGCQSGLEVIQAAQDQAEQDQTYQNAAGERDNRMQLADIEHQKQDNRRNQGQQQRYADLAFSCGGFLFILIPVGGLDCFAGGAEALTPGAGALEYKGCPENTQ